MEFSSSDISYGILVLVVPSTCRVGAHGRSCAPLDGKLS